ncbi:hypothetical protein GGU11DRAFT_667295, partial [Lentinula aff. detonsa]
WMQHPKVIIIDGLDECRESVLQQRIISLVASVLNDNLPFRFLIVSRPEPQIHEAFQTNAMESRLKLLSLDKGSWNTRRDIKTFFETGFTRILTHPRMAHVVLPHPWPAHGVVEELVKKACGQFLYAKTVLEFVNEDHAHPVEQLSIVLGLKAPSQGHFPFKELDLLYDRILLSHTDRNKVITILGTLIRLSGLSGLRRWNNHRSGPCIAVIETLSGLQTGEVSLVLRGMHSVLRIDKTHIHILHSSFREYLCDKSRAGQFY